MVRYGGWLSYYAFHIPCPFLDKISDLFQVIIRLSLKQVLKAQPLEIADHSSRQDAW
ncbi:MAG: hypothetical protein SVW57_04570 [Thermodesulfobacteriota bacterium]|nr:hypothetical protein [Thermodesulfobacteriota bacterium]